MATLGLGYDFTPVVNGQEAALELGLQGLWMFVTNVKVADMDVATDQTAAVTGEAHAANGELVSLPFGCRTRDFVDAGDGDYQLRTAWLLPLYPEAANRIDGTTVTIRIDVRDRLGQHATDERTVIARFKP